MLEYPVSQSPPQNPNNDPRIEDTGYPRNTPMSVPYGRYDPSMGQNPPVVPGFGWNDPVLTEVQRKRSATRKVSLSSGMIGLITMSAQLVITASVFVADGVHDVGLALLVVLMMIVSPFVVGLGWIVTFILALIACIRAHSRTPRVQPDGWIEAKMPTSALLAASIVAGLPTLIIYVTWFSGYIFGSSNVVADQDLLYSLIFICGVAQALLTVGFVYLRRKCETLDPRVRASQVPGTQSA